MKPSLSTRTFAPGPNTFTLAFFYLKPLYLPIFDIFIHLFFIFLAFVFFFHLLNFLLTLLLFLNHIFYYIKLSRSLFFFFLCFHKSRCIPRNSIFRIVFLISIFPIFLFSRFCCIFVLFLRTYSLYVFFSGFQKKTI